MKKKRECKGHCCRQFEIEEYSNLAAIWSKYRQWKINERPIDKEQIYLLAPMLTETHVNDKIYYSCKHQSQCGKCSIYEHRPQMCRDLGTIDPCTHPLCSLNPENDSWFIRFKKIAKNRQLLRIQLKQWARFLPNL